MSTWQLRKPYFHGPGEHIIEFAQDDKHEKLVVQVDESRYFEVSQPYTVALGIFAKSVQ